METFEADNPYETMITVAYNRIDECFKRVTNTLEIFGNFVSTFQKSVLAKETINASLNKESSATSVGEDLVKALPKYVGDTNVLAQLINTVSKNCITPLIPLKNSIDEYRISFKQTIDRCNALLEKAENNYSTCYKEYYHLCETVDNEKDPRKVQEMIPQCVIYEKKCIDEVKLLGEARSKYTLEIERIFTKLELINRVYEKDMTNIINIFNDALTKFSDGYHSNEAETSETIGCMDYKDSNDTKNNELQPILQLQNTYDIDFDIFKYINFKNIYKNTLKGSTMLVNDDINGENVKIKKGSIINAYKNQNGVMIGENIKELQICELSSKHYISPIKYKRKIVKLTSDFLYQNKKYAKNHLFCSIYEEDEKVYCKDESGSIIVIPHELLLFV